MSASRHSKPSARIVPPIYEDFEVLDYQHHPAIKAPVAV